MKLYDSLKAFLTQPLTLSPKAATMPIGGFESANRFSTDRSYIYDTTPAFGETDSYARLELLSLTEYATNNFPIVERILTAVSQYTVGAGITIQAATKDNDFNAQATEYFDNWAVSPFSTVNNDLNFYDLMKLIPRELLKTGEIFFVMARAESGFPQLIAVSAKQVRSSDKKNDKSVDGIFYDDKGKAIAYQIFFSEKPSRIEAGNVIHIKITKEPNQRRGVSAFAASLNSLRDLYDLHNLFKKSAKTHAALAATVTKKSGEVNPQLFNGPRKANPSTVGCSKPAQANPSLEKAFGGAVAYLNEGESVNLLTSSHPQDGYFRHAEKLMDEVCLNIGLNYAFLVSPAALTSAGTRFVIADADAYFRNLQDLIIYACLQRVYGWVLASAIKDKKIKSPTDENYWKASYVTPERITIDKGKEDRTTLEFVQNGLMSMDAYYASRGKTWKDQLLQIAQEKKYIAELEAEYGVSIVGEKIAPPIEITPTETEEEKQAA